MSVITFTVVAVDGEIKIKGQEKPLKERSKFSDTQRKELDYPEGDYFMSVIDDTEHQEGHIVFPDDFGEGGPVWQKSDTPYDLKGKIIETLEEFRSFIQLVKGKFQILGDRLEVPVSSITFPMDDNHFFFLQYNFEAEPKTVHLKLPFIENKIQFDKEEIRKIDSASAKDIQLGYYDQSTHRPLYIDTIQLNLVDDAIAYREVETIINLFEKPEEKVEILFDRIRCHLFHRNRQSIPIKSNLINWLNSNFSQKINWSILIEE